MTAEDATIAQWSTTTAEAAAAMDPDGDFAKRHLLNPVVLGMLGDVEDVRVLDAGSGQGYFSRMLAERGARVVSLEPAGALIAHSRRREAELHQGIELVQADLTTTKLPSDFGAVVCNMVLMSIPGWRSAMRACVDAVRPGGRFLFSIVHPCFEGATSSWVRHGEVRVAEYLADYDVPGPQATDFHRPLSAYLNAVIQMGCRIEEVIEPALDPGLLDDPEAGAGAAALVHVPNFVVVSTVKLD